MSQIVTLKRKITKDELCAALEQSDSLTLGEEHNWGFTIKDSSDPNSFLTFSNGNLEATSPSDELFHKLETLASFLGAEVVLEDEERIAKLDNNQSNGKEIIVFWPVLVLVLLSLLVWRW